MGQVGVTVVTVIPAHGKIKRQVRTRAKTYINRKEKYILCNNTAQTGQVASSNRLLVSKPRPPILPQRGIDQRDLSANRGTLLFYQPPPPHPHPPRMDKWRGHKSCSQDNDALTEASQRRRTAAAEKGIASRSTTEPEAAAS